MRRELLVGCGNSREKRIRFTGIPKDWVDLVTLDFAESVKPDVVHDLNVLPYPFSDNEFDEIHAYEVLEHCGRQGDGAYFFAQFAEFWRIMKPGGYFCLTVPMWDHPLAWGVPDHSRVLPKDIFITLNPKYYEAVGKPLSSVADYRHWLGTTNFVIHDFKETAEQLGLVLQAIK
jgi:SAM-dependent methyltransferase